MTDVFTDTGLNVEKVIASLPEFPQDLLNFVDLIFPGWIVKRASAFSKDLHKFNIGWARGCVQLNVEPPTDGIILVTDSFLGARENRKILSAMIRKIVSMGYMIMDLTNFDTCSECGLVIVSRQRIREKGYSFSGKCQSCFPYDPKKPLPAIFQSQPEKIENKSPSIEEKKP